MMNRWIYLIFITNISYRIEALTRKTKRPISTTPNPDADYYSYDSSSDDSYSYVDYYDTTQKPTTTPRYYEEKFGDLGGPYHWWNTTDYDDENFGYFSEKVTNFPFTYNKVQLVGKQYDVSLVIERQLATVIFLHKIGEFGVSFWHYLIMLHPLLQTFFHIKLVCPTAPRQRYSPANDEYRYVWFNKKDDSPWSEEFINSYSTSLEGLTKIVKEELKIVPAENILIGGMGMGGEMAMHLVFRRYPNIRGLFVLSSHLKNDSVVYKHLVERKQEKYPYMFYAYSHDAIHTKLEWAKQTFDNLQRLGVRGEFHEVVPKPKKHTLVSSTVLDVFVKWLKKILPDEDPIPWVDLRANNK